MGWINISIYEDFVKDYIEDSDIGYILEINFQYLEGLHEPHNDMPFFSWKMKMVKIKKF